MKSKKTFGYFARRASHIVKLTKKALKDKKNFELIDGRVFISKKTSYNIRLRGTVDLEMDPELVIFEQQVRNGSGINRRKLTHEESLLAYEKYLKDQKEYLDVKRKNRRKHKALAQQLAIKAGQEEKDKDRLLTS